jgi:hypothetical protein
MRNKNFLIMEASMQDEELIIGLPELKKMGLDPVCCESCLEFP